MTTMNNEAFEAANTVLNTAKHARRRKRWLIALGLLVLKAGVAYATYDRLHGSHLISTDNAYVAAETAQVTPAIHGIVREVRVNDTQTVRKGDVVVVLDDTDLRLALAEAEAELERALRRVRGYVANDEQLAAQIAAQASAQARADADIAAARADVALAHSELARRQKLVKTGAISVEELNRALNSFASARAKLAAAQAGATQSRANHVAAIRARQANAVLIAGTTEDTNPEVELARTRRDQAQVNLDRTVIRAPVSGVIAKRAVQVGQQVQAGSALLSVVPIADVHVDANYKEGQLDRVRIGQTVEVVSDLYGSDVVYHGVVEGLAGGTGSTFATIPAQNATGNWIKVVQRVPVRIRLDADELAARPLQVGLSMTATIDTRSRVK
jgi:membrane fusion protein, multidrug efflux system